MAKTKENLISDVILQLTQGAPTDDIQIEESQIASWATDYLNDLVKRECVAESKKGKSIPPVYITRETGLELTEEAIADLDDKNQRMYLTLSGEVLDLPSDSGVVKVLDYDLNLIYKTSTENIEILDSLRFARATSENPLFYREGKNIFIKGFNTADLEFNEFIVHYVKKQDVMAMDDEDELLVTDQLVNVLTDLLVERGKTELYGSQSDPESDGTDRKKNVYHTAIQNPASGDQDNQTVEE